MVVALVPLVVICAVLIGLLGVKFTASQLRAATAVATGTVLADGAGSAGLDVEWTDATGGRHRDRRVFPGAGAVSKGARVDIRYVPDNPSRSYAVGEEIFRRDRTYFSGLVFSMLVLLVALLVTATWIPRRAQAERRRVQTFPVSWAQTRRGLIRRSWLIISDGRREWWQPVYWDPVLRATLAGTPARVHGVPAIDKLLPVDLAGQPIWPSGRRRATQPKGELTQNNVRWTKGLEKQRNKDGGPDRDQIPLGRHLLGDIGLVLPAPALGLVWAYLDGSGTGVS
ncbi:MAG TPA: DUF3592 domain-containing protein [Mycobacteriales bacterium]|nr:DUF3592 domain-containing protein [Mycobacteriales bacterium]